MDQVRIHRTALFLLLVMVAAARSTGVIAENRADADVDARNFPEYCSGELSTDRRSRFGAGLRQAEQALAAGNASVAKTALQEAMSAVYRGGAEDSIISVKCFGKATADRWLSAQLAQQRLEPVPAIFVTAADHGARGIIDLVSKQPVARFGPSLEQLRRITQRIEADREFGAFILPKEKAIARACTDARKTLVQLGRKRSANALAEEERVFNRPVTADEKAAADSLEGAQALISSIAGVRRDTATEQETLLVRTRVPKSMELLREARGWDPDNHDNVQSRPTSKRARKRGDAMLASANDRTLSLGARDRFYSAAISYYDFGGWKAQAAQASTAQRNIQASLNAQRARQQAEMKNNLEKKRQELEQAREKMTKTEEEKKRFREEAESLESELGL
ncbi:MAG TPA: hypothetical protein ENK49_00140 [Gammaproteobacteria bacterium]|nr:hypothetical protein [Gammaproteobacteria bacterium]